MSIWHTFDMGYLFRQAFLLDLLCLFPVVLYAAVSKRRRMLLPVAGLLFIVGWLALAVSMAHTNVRIWRGASVPYTPFRVGPSWYSLCDMVPFFGCFVWFPSFVIYSIWCLVLRLRHRNDLIPKATLSVIVFFALAGLLWGWGSVGVLEYDHEDTVWTAGFSFTNWEKVQTGMTRQQVVDLLGQPFQKKISWGVPEGKERMERLWWVRNWSAGYFALIWFDNNRVHRKQFWYSD